MRAPSSSALRFVRPGTAALGGIMVMAAVVLALEAPPIFDLEWGGFGSAAGLFNQPVAIAPGPANEIYVADRRNHRIQKFDEN